MFKSDKRCSKSFERPLLNRSESIKLSFVLEATGLGTNSSFSHNAFRA